MAEQLQDGPADPDFAAAWRQTISIPESIPAAPRHRQREQELDAPSSSDTKVAIPRRWLTKP